MTEKITDVIIPAYHPGSEFETLLDRLEKQDYPINKILIMNTEEGYWNRDWETRHPIVEVHHLTKPEFDHGGTRKKAAEISQAEILVFMTQDAIPCDRHLLRNLVTALTKDDNIGAAYGRQLPKKDCGFVERYTRSFNYPETSSVKTAEDLPVYGIKTFFCSNVCAAYRKEIYDKLGGFVERTIFNEDMIYAGNLIKAGYGIAYAADAKVLHSHNYSCMEQFHRNFDLGVSQAEHPEIFQSVPSEGEGIRLVKKTFSYLLKTGRVWLIPGFIMQSAFKYAGYRTGKNYQKLSLKMRICCSMNPSYWKK